MRGRLDAAGERALHEFWRRRAGFAGEAARRRLPEVVCVVRRDGAVVGASSVFAGHVELVGGWRFWVLRALLDERLEDLLPALIGATFEALDAGHRTDHGEPVGLCALLDAEQRRRRPEAEWPETRMVYAGYSDDGRQVRIAYFRAEVSRMAAEQPEAGWTPPGYRIEPFEGGSGIDREQIVDTWVAEAGLPRAEAERRLSEVLLVALDPDGSLAGLCTAYLARNDQLRADMWHYRTFVRAPHRKSNLAVALITNARDHLVERFTSGRDRRGLGILFELENEGLKRRFPKGLWYESDFLFIGENARGDHVRVHYFPGALAPEPTAPPPAAY